MDTKTTKALIAYALHLARAAHWALAAEDKEAAMQLAALFNRTVRATGLKDMLVSEGIPEGMDWEEITLIITDL